MSGAALTARKAGPFGDRDRRLADADRSTIAAGHARLQALFEAHYDFVWRSVRRLGVSAAAADDATQEIFLVASRRLDDIALGRERAFLFGTALRVASDARRAVARKPATLGSNDAVFDQLASDAPSPEELVDRAKARDVLDRIVQSMPLELRAVFVLFELEGLTMAEIASMLDTPPGTVASRLRRGRERFQGAVRRLQSRAGANGGQR